MPASKSSVSDPDIKRYNIGMQKDITIRPYESKNDKDQVLKCIIDLQEHERAVEPSKLPGKDVADDYLAYIVFECKEKNGEIFVADNAGEILGFSCVWIDEDDDPTVSKESLAYLSDLYVKPEFRRQGIATKLMQARKQYALDRGIRKIRVCTLAKNIGIQETLKSQGFTPHEITWEANLN